MKRNEVVKARMLKSYPGVPVYCVSARDYSRIAGFEQSEPDTFMKEDDTEIPKLRADIFNAIASRRIMVQMDIIIKADATLRL